MVVADDGIADMTKQTRLYLTLAVACFAVVLELYRRYLLLLSAPNSPFWSQWGSFLVAVGLFAIVFQLLLSLSLTISRRWISEESRLVGDWHQVFVIHNYTKGGGLADSVRHGPVRIALTEGGLEITAENRKASGNAAPSGWHSNQVSLQGSQVWLLFSSTGPGRGSTHGNMLFHNQSRKPWSLRLYRLTGQFSDSSPATHFGSIEFYRSKDDYEARLTDLLSRPTAAAAP